MVKFWLFSLIDSGGGGCVYKAFDTETGKICVVKTLLDEIKNDKAVVEAFIREAEIGLEICSHPNIGTVIEYGQNEEEYYMAAEFIDGDRLDVLVSNNKNGIDEEKVLLWGIQILSALQHIYSHGYLYRDLKPQNLIVCDDGKEIILYDFGLCLELDKVENNIGDTVEGSPQYFPPERCNFEKEDMSSEIYSLGMVLFFCLDGAPYYQAETAMELLQQHIRQLRIKSVPERLEKYNPDIVAIIDKMIKRDTEKRFQTYNEIILELKNVYKMYESC